MPFEKKNRGYEIIKEAQENIIRIDASSWSYLPNIENNPLVMSYIIDLLNEVPNVTRIIFNQRRNYIYNYDQTQMLVEVANLYSHLIKQKRLLSLANVGQENRYGNWNVTLQKIILTLLKQDPIGAYVQLIREIRQERVNLENVQDVNEIKVRNSYIELLSYIKKLFESTKLIILTKDYISGYAIGEDRSLYRQLFNPEITPDFMFTRLMAEPPINAEELEIYKLDEDTEINILKIPGDIKYLYHVSPPEFKISEDKYEILDLARQALIEHKPTREEFTDPEKMRQTFFNIGRDLLQELAEARGLELSFKEVEQLASILVRYTVGFGLIEVLLQDQKIQDITINGPIGQSPIFIVHQDYDECVTNIIPSLEDGESWASKFRLSSGRPLDEANPVLDTELILKNARARAAIITKPLNPSGLAFALRRHRDEPWTYPLFINNKMFNPLAAGLLSFLVDGARTILFSGTRSSGKCVDGNTLIQMWDGRIIKIKDLIGEEKDIIKDGKIFYPKEDYSVLCLDKFNFTKSNINSVWKRTSPENVIKLKTRSGKEIITTAEHPYFIYNNGLITIRADNLKKGDLIATPRKIDLNTKEVFIDLSKELYCKKILEDNFILKGKTNSLTIKFPKRLTKELAEFIGLVLGDGHLDATKLEFHNSCDELRSQYKILLNMFNIPYREFKSRTTTVVQVSSRVLSRVLHDYFEIPFGNKSNKIFIPSLILKSDNEVLSSFLRGYFDTDGYTPKDKRDIEIVTASKPLSEQLKLVLLRFGIVCFSKIKIVNGVNYYRCLIRGQFVNKFSKSIGFSHPFKKNRLIEIINTKFMNNTNVDIIPNGSYILSNLRKLLRVSQQQHRLSGKDSWAYENKIYNVTRDGFKRIIKFYKKRYYNIRSFKEQIDFLAKSLLFNYDSYINNFEKLRKLLNLSYLALSIDTKLTDTTIRKILQKKRNASYETLNKFDSVIKHFEQKLKELEYVSSLEPKVNNLPTFIKAGIITYASISREFNVPETTLKSYIYGGINAQQFLIEKLENKLFNIKLELIKNLEESNKLIKNIYLSIPEYIQIGIILSRLRGLLNIKNEEFLSEKLHTQTISNFFNGKYVCELDVIQKIAGKIISLYESCVSDKVINLIIEADGLANSKIFWDEVLEIDTIKKVDDFIYDLTVENTHNFIANGLIAHNTSLLGSTLVEIMRKYRIISVEDTQELPIDSLRKLGYNIQGMKVRSALTHTTSELGADEGIRTSLRLGDSSLIVGEIRSLEAQALYEAMRIGALANVVAGTIHGADPYSVYDRVVNDLNVPKTSFKATDVIVVSNPVRTADGLHKARRILQITEVRKHWQDDPLKENGFIDLMTYDTKNDTLKPSQDLINGDSEILKSVASNIKEFSGNWDAVWENILLRARIKEALVKYALKIKQPLLLESKFTVQSNDIFHQISDKIREELGYIDNKRVFFDWNEWIKDRIKKKEF